MAPTRTSPSRPAPDRLRGRGRRRARPRRARAGGTARGRLDRALPRRDAGGDAAGATPPRSPGCWPLRWPRGSRSCPRAGNTGLVGGGVPLHGEIVLSLRRLDRLGPVDDVAAQVTRGPASRSRPCRRHVAAAGLAYGVDLAARGSATVGGTIATNAGGVHVLRWGDDPAPGGGHRGGHRGRAGPAPLGRAGQGQHRLRPRRPAVRIGGHPRRRHRGPARARPRLPSAVVALCAFADVAAAVRVAGGGAAVGSTPSTPPSCSSTTAWRWCARSPVGPAPFGAEHPVLRAVRGVRVRRPDRRPRRGAGGAERGARCRRGHRPGSAGRPVGLPRGAHLGDQHARPTAQARRDPARCPASPRSSNAVPDGGAGPWRRTPGAGSSATSGDGNVHVNVTGPRSRRRAVDDAVLSLVVVDAAVDQRRARHRHGEAQLAGPPAQRRRRWPTFRAIKQAMDPARDPEPQRAVLTGPTSWQLEGNH